MNLFDVKGKVVLITGKKSGFGLSMALELFRAGAKIVVSDISKEVLNRTLSEYKSVGIEVYGCVLEITNETVLIESMKHIEAEVGTIDILISKAGIIKRDSIGEMAVENFATVIIGSY